MPTMHCTRLQDVFAIASSGESKLMLPYPREDIFTFQIAMKTEQVYSSVRDAILEVLLCSPCKVSGTYTPDCLALQK